MIFGARLQLSILLLIACFGSTSVLAESRDANSYFFQQSLGDFSEELQIAKEDGKLGLLLFFEEDNCPFCARMKQTVLNQVQVQDYFRRYFNIYALDIEGDVEMIDFNAKPTTERTFSEKQFRVRATPVIAFVDLNGQLIRKFTGATRDAAEFMLLGRYIVEGHYKQGSFTRFKRSQKK
ncbi:MAG: thioredoxin fold domain-containing protein [gamma proteobacterium symbiont of Bathyaustriella thionipta]|nr:thioredoxin fold domain-containing protein [gamma proteobacterium symbiont of Bathyaustriella thionipta]